MGGNDVQQHLVREILGGNGHTLFFPDSPGHEPLFDHKAHLALNLIRPGGRFTEEITKVGALLIHQINAGR